MTLYRYFKAIDAKKTLENGFLKTSRCLDLNDPFEWSWRPEPTAEEAVRQFKEKYPDTDEESLKKCHELYEGLVRFAMNKQKDEDQSLRVICFSSDNVLPQNEVMMWSHYADKHKGIRLGFDFKDWRGIFVKMDYEPDPTMIKINDLGSIDKMLCLALKKKSSVWGYESEKRLYISHELCEKIPIDDGSIAEFIKIKYGELVSVTIGAKFEGDADHLKKHALLINQDVKFYKAVPSLYEYKLDYIPF